MSLINSRAQKRPQILLHTSNSEANGDGDQHLGIQIVVCLAHASYISSESLVLFYFNLFIFFHIRFGSCVFVFFFYSLLVATRPALFNILKISLEPT